MLQKQDLGGQWAWRAEDEESFHKGTVPGSVLCDMLAQGLMEDPFWRSNEYAARELMGKDYLYQRSFLVQEASLSADEITLVFEGLDTLAAVYLNGQLAAKTHNMHRTYRLPVKSLLRAGENEISVWFSAPLRFVRQEDAQNDIHYASTGCLRGNAALRKAHYMFGWDWGPQLPDIGIFRPVYLEFATAARFTDLRIRQFHTRPGEAVELTVETAVQPLGPEPLEVAVTVAGPDGFLLQVRQPWQPGESLGLVVENPLLWWPNGLGAQPLYTVTASLYCGGALQDQLTRRVGLRTITVSTAADPWGNEFAFVVNGHKVFAMGANYVPQDNLIPRITPRRYRDMVAASAAANMNMLRVWGGGYYPDDAFYDACDEYGIMVWQDLMFACNVYALNPDFEENIIRETQDNVRRLRHHASLALWCGNNEMEWGWGEGWQRILGHHPRYKADYLKIFEMVLPRALASCDDQTFFWPSSPSSGGAYDYPNDPDRGDQHYWEVWHSGKPFTQYRAHHFRFCSEYGFQSFPGIKTIQGFTLPQDRNIFSEVMESHQKNGQANSKIFTYVSDYFLYPKDLDSIAYISQILQLKAIQYGVEHWRQNRGRCMGSLYWQLNDCWPVASWASIDYHGRWKALHYGARRFYAPVCASAREKEELSGEITYYVHNDTLAPRPLRLEVALLDTEFHVLRQEAWEGEALPLSSQGVLTADFGEALGDPERKKRLLARYRLFDQDGACVGEGCTQFVKPKHFAYPAVTYASHMRDAGDCYEILLSASGFSHYTELYFTQADGVFSDNFFDITQAGEKKVLLPKAGLSADPGARELARQLVVRSVAHTYLREGE